MGTLFSRLTAVLVLAGALAAAPLRSGAQEPALAPGDTLSFAILGILETDREIPVGLDGTVFLPLIGSLQAEGRTLGELRAAVEERLRISPVRIPERDGENVWRALGATEVIVDIAQYRPVYVSGDVASPGEIAFRPGMTVRQAVAKAGGTRVFHRDEDLRLVEMMARRDRARDQLRAARAELERLRADLDRLESAAGDRSAEAGPAQTGEQTGELSTTGIEWLDARATLHARNRASHALQLEQMENRLAVLRELEQVSQETVRIEEDNLARVKDLSDRGVATAAALDTARQDLLQASSRALETAGELFRLEVEIARTRDAMTIEDTEERVRLLERIEAETDRLAELETQYRRYQDYLAAIGAGLSDDEDATTVVSLFRDAPQSRRNGPADPDERVMPGDVLEVRIEAER